MAFESEAEESKLVTIHAFTNELEADLAKGALEASGLIAWLPVMIAVVSGRIWRSRVDCDSW